jgi:uncharacterized protein with ParB-like and HNH nuclease domain
MRIKTTKPLSGAERQARYRLKYRQYSFGAQEAVAKIIEYYQAQNNCTVTQAIERLIYHGYKSLSVTKK